MNDSQETTNTADGRAERLIALLYGELPAPDAEALRRQVEADPELGRCWEELRQARGLLGALAGRELSSPAWDPLDAPASRHASRSIRGPGGPLMPERRPRWHAVLFASAWGATAAAILLLALGYARLRAERNELRAYSAEISRNVAVLLDDRARQRDAETAAWLQLAFEEMDRRQARDYGDLRFRIEQVGIGLAREQCRNNDQIDWLLRLDSREQSPPALVPATEEGDTP